MNCELLGNADEAPLRFVGGEAPSGLLERIRQNQAAAAEELYHIVNRSVRSFISRTLGAQDSDDLVNTVFLSVLIAVKNDRVRNPEALAAFCRSVASHEVMDQIGFRVRYRAQDNILYGNLKSPSDSPEESLFRAQRVEIMKKVLHKLSDRDREILMRFYLKDQTQEQICEELNLTATQFRLLKSQAKARFAEIGRKTIESPKKPLMIQYASAGSNAKAG